MAAFHDIDTDTNIRAMILVRMSMSVLWRPLWHVALKTSNLTGMQIDFRSFQMIFKFTFYFHDT